MPSTLENSKGSLFGLGHTSPEEWQEYHQEKNALETQNIAEEPGVGTHKLKQTRNLDCCSVQVPDNTHRRVMYLPGGDSLKGQTDFIGSRTNRQWERPI